MRIIIYRGTCNHCGMCALLMAVGDAGQECTVVLLRGSSGCEHVARILLYSQVSCGIFISRWWPQQQQQQRKYKDEFDYLLLLMRRRRWGRRMETRSGSFEHTFNKLNIFFFWCLMRYLFIASKDICCIALRVAFHHTKSNISAPRFAAAPAVALK